MSEWRRWYALRWQVLCCEKTGAEVTTSGYTSPAACERIFRTCLLWHVALYRGGWVEIRQGERLIERAGRPPERARQLSLDL